MTAAAPLRVLVVYRTNEPGPMRTAVAHHLRVLEHTRPRHEVFYYDARLRVPRWLAAASFDVVVLHTTFLGMRWSDVFPLWKQKVAWLNDVDCLKIALPQDDYDRSEILDEWLLELGVTDVFSVFGEHERAVLYPLMHSRARFHDCLTGYIDEGAAERCRSRLVPADSRLHDVVYRASRLPYRFGRHGQLKHELGNAVAARAAAHGLSCDVSTRTEDTILGERWLDFLMSSRAVIGCEGGSSALDRRGELEAAIADLLRAQPSLSFEQVTAELPEGWDDYRFFTLSPRHLEAVVTQTAQILVEGHYAGALEPNRHYLPVKRDLSDLDDALEQTKDVSLMTALAERAYEDVYVSGAYSYRRFAADLEAVLGHARRRRRGARAAAAWRLAGPAVHLERAVDDRRPVVLGRLVASPRSSLEKGVAALRLTTAHPTTRRLLLDFMRDSEARRAVSAQRVVGDLLRLNLLRLRGSRPADGGVPFDVSAVLEDAGRRLRLTSVPVGSGRDGTSVPDIEAGLREGRVASIVWDHSAVGDEIPVPGARGRVVKVGDAYEFGALALLCRRFAAHTASAIAAMLEPERRG
jgi:hypothetical protein